MERGKGKHGVARQRGKVLTGANWALSFSASDLDDSKCSFISKARCCFLT